ncbi:MAG: IPT/TIG domain-containing protein, partial [Bryobacteraceae bacterium]
LGTMTFTGNGNYSYSAQQVVGAAAATSQTGSGTYSVDPAGFVSLDSPLRSGDKINARFGPSMVVGSTTESSDNTYDLFAAIQAPTTSVAATLPGAYWAVSLELPGGVYTNARSTQFNLTSTVQGQFSAVTVNGHAANLSSGLPTTQQVSNATYTMGPDGTGSFSFGAASNAQLLSGGRTVYVSADGNILLGGNTAAGSHDFLFAVKSLSGATNATWNADYFGAGLRVDPNDPGQPVALGYAAAVSARGVTYLTWTKRFKEVGAGAYDFTGCNDYSLTADGSGAANLSSDSVALGAGGKAFDGVVLSSSDPGFEIFFGVQMASLSGTGVFLNPQRVLNGAGYAPAGNPIAPGEFVSLFGTGLAPSPKAGLAPYPFTLNGVTVLINGKQAPIQFVSTTQINALVPYSTQGPTATIVVQNGTASSNTVTVPVAVTAPGVFALDQSGTGAGAVLHLNGSVVNASSPATPGEIVEVFLTGMGAVTPSVADGAIPGASNINATPLSVYVADVSVTPSYAGMAPGYPGLYQMNITIPLTISTTGPVPLAINAPNAFHDQVSVAVQ